MVAAMIFTALSALAQEPVEVQALRRAFEEAYRLEDWDEAIEIGLDLVELVPRSVEQYNLACAYALSGDARSALRWLERSAANGFYQLSQLESDADLDIVRDLPGYRGVRLRVARNLDHHQEILRKEAAETPPLIVVPNSRGEGGKRPLLVVLHGYGDHAARYLAVWGPAARKIGAILAVPSGAQRVGSGRGWGSVDQADVIVQLTVEYVRERYDFDQDQVILAGFSQGGFMAMALALRYPNRFVGVISMAGPYVPETDSPPPAGNDDPRYYFMVGSLDRLLNQVRRAATDFEEAGYETRLRVVPETPHDFPRAARMELGRALNFVLGD